MIQISKKKNKKFIEINEVILNFVIIIWIVIG